MDVIYILDQPLDARNRLRFGLDYLLSQGDRVTVLDLTPLLHPAVAVEFARRGGVEASDGLCFLQPRSRKLLLAQLRRLECRGAVLLDMCHDTPLSALAKVLLRWRGARRVQLISGVLPEPRRSPVERGLLSALARNFRAHGMAALRVLVAKALRVVASRVFPLLVPTDVWIVTCSSAQERVPLRDRLKPRVLLAHTFDYDRYLEVQGAARTTDRRPYAVFLDEDMCFHVDFLYTNTTAPATADRYFPALNRLFDRIRATLELEILVAEHPRARYSLEQRNEFFPGCEVIRDRSAELIRDASLVICHASTSIGMAVLFEKPLLFLSSDQIGPTYLGAYVRAFHAELGGILLNMDHVDGIQPASIVVAAVQEERYSAYTEKYLKCAATAPDQMLWSLVRNGIQDGGG